MIRSHADRSGQRTAALVAILLFFSSAATSNSQPYLPLYEGPSYDGTTGYTNPRFRSSSYGVASPGLLINNSGRAAWDANRLPANERSALRWNPLSGAAAQLQDLGVGGPATAIPFAINAIGGVVGYAVSEQPATPGDKAVRWNAAGTFATILPGLNTNSARSAFDINDSGIVVGYSAKSTDEGEKGERAVRWDAAGNIVEMDSISSTSFDVAYSRAFAINNGGTSVGGGAAFVSNMIKGDRAVRWNAAGDATQLGHLGTDAGGTTSSTAWALNSSGQAIGYATKYNATGISQGQRATLWNAGTTTAVELSLLGSNGQNISPHTKANDINDAGAVVGHAVKYTSGINRGRRAVRWNSAGTATELGLLGTNASGVSFSEAYDVNEAGIAVGTMDKYVAFANQGRKAVYWRTDGTAVDLNTLIAPNNLWELTAAWAVSDTGWVLGEGTYLYDPDGPGGQGGLTYNRVFMLQLPINVALPGDYNADGTVDAADYVVWRKNRNTNTTLPNDSTPGSVIDFDYGVWRANFGDHAIGAATDSLVDNVPEPRSLWIALIAAAGAIFQHRRVRRFAMTTCLQHSCLASCGEIKAVFA